MILGQPDQFGFRSIELGHVWFSAILMKVFFFFLLKSVFSEGALWPILVVLVKGKNEFLSNKALKNYKNIKGFFFFNIWPKILKIL
jgi:hypothetical protein